MAIICAKSLDEYPWEIEDTAQPHQRGERQDSVDETCDCVPMRVSSGAYDLLVKEAWRRLEETDSAIKDEAA